MKYCIDLLTFYLEKKMQNAYVQNNIANTPKYACETEKDATIEIKQ